MGFQYPPVAPTVNDEATALQVHHLLNTPELITRRVQSITDQGFIADFLLPNRYTAVGGAVVFETGGESIYPQHSPEAIEPFGEYPLTTFSNGAIATVTTTKWGDDSPVSDEAISRQRINPVERGLRKLSNGMIRHIDGVALGLIGSAVKTEITASGLWKEAERIVEDVLTSIAKREEALIGEGYDFQTIVLRPVQHALVVASFINSGLLPRENNNGANSGVVSGILGKDWVTSPNVPFGDPFVVDRNFLGGMADEDIQSPGYARSTEGVGIETKVIREEKTDGYLLRARRVTAPVVMEPLAGFTIKDTGL